MKYNDIKDRLSYIFEEAKDCLNERVYEDGNSTFIIYRGFKISKYFNTGYIEILNVRSSDFYKPIPDNVMTSFIARGFEKTCDILQITRDKRRIFLLTKRIRTTIENNDAKKRYELTRDRRGILKRIINIKSKWKD